MEGGLARMGWRGGRDGGEGVGMVEKGRGKERGKPQVNE